MMKAGQLFVHIYGPHSVKIPWCNKKLARGSSEKQAQKRARSSVAAEGNHHAEDLLTLRLIGQVQILNLLFDL